MRKVLAIIALLSGLAFAQNGSVTFSSIVQLANDTGYPDTNSRQIARTSGGVVYIMVPAQLGNTNNEGTGFHMYKGSPAGNPTSFSEVDASHRPTCAFRAEGDELRMVTGSSTIQAAFGCSTASNAGHGGYVTFNTTNDTWGTPETICTYTAGVIYRYISSIGMAVDVNGVPHAICGGYAQTASYYNRISGTWGNAHSLGAYYERPSMQFDASGNLHIALLASGTPTYLTAATAEVYFQRTAGGTWIGPETISSTSDDFDTNNPDTGPSLVFDAAGLPNVSWLGADPNANAYIRKRTATNTWTNVTMASGSGNLINGHSPCLYADAAHNMYVFEGHQMVSDNLNCPLCEPHFNWRLDSSQAWHSFAGLATSPPVRDGGGCARYDNIYPGDPQHIDLLSMVENFTSGDGNLAYLHGVPASASVVHYVTKTGTNSGNCTVNPCLTITYAYGQAAAGDIVQVGAGTYAESLTLNRAGSAGNLIAVQGYPVGGSCATTPQTDSMNPIKTRPAPTVTINGASVAASYNTLDCFNIPGGVSIRGTNITGSSVMHNYMDGGPSPFGGEGIDIDNLWTTRPTGMRFSHNYITRFQYGWVVHIDNSLFDYNEVDGLYATIGNTGDCDYTRLWGSGDTYQRNYFHGAIRNFGGNVANATCLIWNGSDAAHVDGVQTFSDDGASIWMSRNMTFDGNTFQGFDEGFMLSNDSAPTSNYYGTWTVVNNIFDVRGGDGPWCGVFDSQDFTVIYNNNVCIDGLVVIRNSWGCQCGASMTAHNNIFLDDTSNYRGTSIYAPDVGGTTAGSGGNVQYQPARGGLSGSGDYNNVNPQLVDWTTSGRNFHPSSASSFVVGKATNVGLTTDHDGYARPSGSPSLYDIGAYQFTETGAPVQAFAPSCVPTSGTVPQTVTCTNPNTGTTVMCYAVSPTTPATNGSGTACSSGTAYSSPLSVVAAETLRVVAGVAGDTDSAVVSYTYTAATIPPVNLTEVLITVASPARVLVQAAQRPVSNSASTVDSLATQRIATNQRGCNENLAVASQAVGSLTSFARILTSSCTFPATSPLRIPVERLTTGDSAQASNSLAGSAPLTYAARTDGCVTGLESGCGALGLSFQMRTTDTVPFAANAPMNSCVTDPDFHSFECMVTDQTVNTSTSVFNMPDGQFDAFSKNSSMFFVGSSGGNSFFFYLDAAKIRAAESGGTACSSSNKCITKSQIRTYSSPAVCSVSCTQIDTEGFVWLRSSDVVGYEQSSDGVTFNTLTFNFATDTFSRSLYAVANNAINGVLPSDFYPIWVGTFNVSDDGSISYAIEGAGDWHATTAITSDTFVFPSNNRATCGTSGHCWGFQGVSGTTGGTIPAQSFWVGCATGGTCDESTTGNGGTAVWVGNAKWNGQGPGFWYVNYRPAKGWSLWNTYTGKIFRGAGNPDPAGTITTDDDWACAGTSTPCAYRERFTIHDGSSLRDSRYSPLTPTTATGGGTGCVTAGTCSCTASNATYLGAWNSATAYKSSTHDTVYSTDSPYYLYLATTNNANDKPPSANWALAGEACGTNVWQVDSTIVRPCMIRGNEAQGHCAGHSVHGYKYLFKGTNGNLHLWSKPSINGAANPGTAAFVAWPADNHGYYRNMNTNDDQPAGQSQTDVPTGSYSTIGNLPYYGEFTMSKFNPVTGPVATYRMVHTDNTGSSPFFANQNNLAGISQDGQWALIGTDEMGTRGNAVDGTTSCNNLRGFYSQTARAWSLNDTMFSITNNTNSSVFKVTTAGTTTGAAPNWNTCSTVSSTCTWSGVVFTNQGINNCRSDVKLVDLVSAH